MAKDFAPVYTCDPCDENYDIPNVPAVASHVISIDGGEPKALDFCVRDEADFQKLLELYKNAGRSVQMEFQQEAPKKSRPAAKPKAKELEAPKKTAEQLPIEDKPDAKKDESKPRKERKFVLCPNDHATTGGPLEVDYEHRGSHAQAVHNGAKMWQIRWRDPHSVLKAYCYDRPCDGLGFTSNRGLHQHKSHMHGTPATETDGDAQAT